MLDYMVPILAAILASQASPEKLATDKIIAYAESGSNPIPTLVDYHNAGVSEATTDNLAELNFLVDSLEASDVDTATERLSLVPLLTLELAPFENVVKTEYFAPFSIQSQVTYGGSESVHYYVESNTTQHIELNVSNEGLLKYCRYQPCKFYGDKYH